MLAFVKKAVALRKAHPVLHMNESMKEADYLARNTIQEAASYARGKPWSRVIWDVTAVAWLMNDDYRFMHGRLCPSPIPEYDGHYAIDPNRHFITYVYEIYRDALMEELFRRLGGMK